MGRFPNLTNEEKLRIIEEYLEEGHLYSEIRQKTKNRRNLPIGRWIGCWRQGHVQISYSERQKLMKMGETFQSKLISNKGKLAIIWEYLNAGNLYTDIVQTTKDKNGYPIGQWVYSWRRGIIPLTEEEKNRYYSWVRNLNIMYISILTILKN